MKRYATVEAAVVLVVENLEANHITCDTESIRNRIYSWYSHSDVTDPEMLAACALQWGDWVSGISYDFMLATKEYWFPHNIEDNFSIGEIEDAQRDERWW